MGSLQHPSVRIPTAIIMIKLVNNDLIAVYILLDKQPVNDLNKNVHVIKQINITIEVSELVNDS